MEAGGRDNVIECECGGTTSLDVLNDVQKAYEHRIELLERLPQHKRMPMQVCVLKQWVCDLGAQNSLLARAVTELEAEASARLLLEQRKNTEVVCELRAELAVLRRRLARKDSDLRGLVEVLRRLRDLDYCSLDGIHFFEVTESDIFGKCDWNQKTLAQGDLRHNLKHNSARLKHNPKNHDLDKRNVTCGEVNEKLRKENCAKDREIRKLHKDAQQYEQTIKSLRSEISLGKYQTPDCLKKDVEVMVGTCCTGAECGDWAPVKDINSVLREEMLHYQERIQKMESNLKESGNDVRALRKANVVLREELHAVRGACAALGEQARAAALRGQFKDEIIREMRRQLKHAKAKDSKCHATTCTNNSDMTQNAATCTCYFITPVCASTPNCSQRNLVDCCSDISIIENTCPQSSVGISPSCSDLDEEVILQCSLCPSSVSLHEPTVSCDRNLCDRLSSTCNLGSTCPKTNPDVTTNSCPSTVELAKEWLTNKSGELKDEIQNLIFSESKSCQSKHVDFTSSCDLRRKHGPESCKSCSQACDEPCEQIKLDKDSTPCKFINANKLCKNCRHISDAAPCHSIKSCMKHADISDKTCEQSNVILDSVCCKSIKLCENCDISKKLCKDCKRLFDSTACADRSCKNLDIAKKLCEHCRHVYFSTQSREKHVDISNRPCEKCKNMPPTSCLPDNTCQRCDITEKLCKECKNVFKSIPCIDRSCKNMDLANKLCEHCKQIYASAPCQLESFKRLDTGKILCGGCSDLDPSTCKPGTSKSCKTDTGKLTEQYHTDSSQCDKSCPNDSAQVPKEDTGCKKFEELFINDQAVGCSSTELWIEQETKSTSFKIQKESICRSRGSSPESPGSSCATARARYYQNKLLATLQILQNKEETVRVQAESLAVAESRIAALNARHTDLRREIERKEREIQTLRKSLKECRTCKVDVCDVSLTAEIQEMDDQKNIVTTLQNNLDVIEDLYRECFYESVKQENIIEMLRKSYLDVRLMDKEKCDRISKLHNVINTQKLSLDRCQDIATEVDNLKMEISNFINSSNNDSGVWEESVVGGLSEDLQEIAAQLLRLRDLLTGDCTCGLQEENKRLRQENESVKGENCNLRTQLSDLEANLLKKECLDRQCKEEIEIKERELNCIRGQIRALAEDTKEKSACNDSLMQQLTDTKALLDDKNKELCCLQKRCCVYEDTIKVMKEELVKSEEVNKEKESLRKELCCVSRRATRVQRRAAELEAELARARDHCDRVDAAYREKTSNVVELERQLDCAHARGAALCAEAGRVVRAARCWAARMKDIHREQEKQIKQKESTLLYIKNELRKRQVNICPRVFEQTEEACSARLSTSEIRSRAKRSDNSCPTVTFGRGESRHDGTGSSGSEIASCSSSPTPLGRDAPCVADVPSCSASVPHCSADVPHCSADVPHCSADVPHCSADVSSCLPSRTCKKLADYGVKCRYGWAGPFRATRRDVGAQHPPAPAPCPRCARAAPDTTLRGPVSPGEEMFSRMESLSVALADGYKRWTRRAPP